MTALDSLVADLIASLETIGSGVDEAIEALQAYADADRPELPDEIKPPEPGPEPEPGDEPPEANLDPIRTALSQTASGKTFEMPDGIYRLRSNQPLHIPGGVTLRNANKRAWLFLSRDWAPGGEGVNSLVGLWPVDLEPYGASLQPNEPGGVSYFDQAKALRYETIVGIAPDGQVTRFEHGSGPEHYTLDGQRHIVLGSDPAGFKRIEVVEADPATGRFFWPDGDGVTLDGIVMRYCASGPFGDPAGSHDRIQLHDAQLRRRRLPRHRAQLRRLEERQHHGLPDRALRQHRLQLVQRPGHGRRRNQIYHCGDGGWDVMWQGGATKFTVTSNQSVRDNVIQYHVGSGLWWDESCSGPIHVEGNLVTNCSFPCFHFEISSGPITVTGNCFAYTTSRGWPTTYVSSSTGPGDIYDNLIITRDGRGLQVYQETSRTNDKDVRDWHWHDNHYIIELDDGMTGAAIYVNDVAAGADRNNHGAREQYNFVGGSHWFGDTSHHTDVNSWNGTPFDNGGSLVDAATAASWRQVWGV